MRTRQGRLKGVNGMPCKVKGKICKNVESPKGSIRKYLKALYANVVKRVKG